MNTQTFSKNVRGESTALIRLRIRYIQALAFTGFIVAIIGLAFELRSGSSIYALGSTVVFALVSLGLLWLVRNQLIRAASVILVVMCAFASVTGAQSFALLSILTVTSAAALLNRSLYLVANAVIFSKAFYELSLLWANPQDQALTTIAKEISVVLGIFVVSAATRYFINQTQRAAQDARTSADLIQSVAETGQVLAKLLNTKEVLPRAVELIRDKFGFYHAQIFLVDELGQDARLTASTGTVGQKLFERQHKLPVGSKSVIGQVTATGRFIVARDTDPIYYRNELLPNTRSELALPIFDGDQIIGALDVQSRRVDVFDDEMIQALQVLANLLATSISNARLFEAQERNTRETKRLFLEAETNLREIQRLNQQLTSTGWQEYLGSKRPVSGITIEHDQIINEAEWTENLVKASSSRQSITEQHNGQPVVAVPLILSNEVIGAIEIEIEDAGREAEAAEMAKAIAQRLALSLDKARLFEESQEATVREQRINEIVARYQTVNSVDDLLQITLSELGETFGATHGSIRLSAAPVGNLNGGSHVQ